MSTKLTEENPLSARELDVAQLLVTGASNAEMARDLVISPQTVKVHVRNLYEKLGANSRAEATLLLFQKGWLDLSDLDIAPMNGEIVAELPEPEPLADRREQPQLWQKFYLFGAALLCLILLWAPNRFDRPQSARADLLTDATSATIGQPDVEISSRWTFRVPMPIARSRLAVTSQSDWVYALGGEDQDGRAVDTANAYNVSINEWRPISPLPLPLSNAASATYQNQLYVAGGNNGGMRIDDAGNIQQDDSGEQPLISDSLLVYDLETALWNGSNRLPNPLTGAALVAADDAIYLIGGWDGETMHNEIWRLAPNNSDIANTDQQARWELVTRLDVPRAFLGATEVAGELYVVGGYDGRKELALADVYTLATDRWRRLPDLSFPRGGLSLVADDLAIFALGGGWTTPLENHERFDLATAVWSNFPSPIKGTWRHLAAASSEEGGYLHLIGGWSGDYMDLHLRYQSSFRSLLPVISNDR